MFPVVGPGQEEHVLQILIPTTLPVPSHCNNETELLVYNETNTDTILSVVWQVLGDNNRSLTIVNITWQYWTIISPLGTEFFIKFQ